MWEAAFEGSSVLGFGNVRYSSLPRDEVLPGHHLVSAPDGDCFIHSLLPFFRWTVVGEQDLDEVLAAIVVKLQEKSVR